MQNLRKKKSTFMIYAEFESVLAPDGKEKRNINKF